MVTNYRHLEQIKTLAALKSFAKASRQLNLSQPALSRSILNLEDQLGVKLFDRQHNNVTPTVFGKFLVDRGEYLLQELKLLNRDLHLLRDNQAGEIHLGCGPFPAEIFIGEAVAKFHSTYPKLDIHITVDMTPRLLTSLRERTLDVFVADTRMILEEDLEITHVKQKRAYFCCSQKHPLAKKKNISLQDILAYPLATMWLPPAVISMLNNIAGINLSDITDWPCGAIKCDNFSILLNIVNATNAITISTEAVINKSRFKDSFTFLPLILPEFVTHFGIVSLKNCTLPPAIEALHQCLKDAAEM